MFPCFEAAGFSFESLSTLKIEPLSKILFAWVIGGGNKKIHTKLNCISDESGKIIKDHWRNQNTMDMQRKKFKESPSQLCYS